MPLGMALPYLCHHRHRGCHGRQGQQTPPATQSAIAPSTLSPSRHRRVFAHDAVRILTAPGRAARRLDDGMLEWRLAGLPVAA